jgi:hypothetical protein
VSGCQVMRRAKPWRAALDGVDSFSGRRPDDVGGVRNLWQVVHACVADFNLTRTPFPCLNVDLSGGEQGGNVVLRPPLSDDTILALPTLSMILTSFAGFISR